MLCFRGWNDAADAASDTARHLIEAWGLEHTDTLDDDMYYDYTVVRPVVEREDGRAALTWPTCDFHTGTVPGTSTPVTVVLGFEPNFRWKTFADELVSLFSPQDRIVLLGALLADVAHSRPLPVACNSERTSLVDDETIYTSEYAGPAGITSVLALSLDACDVPAVSLWVAVPGYASASPSPKAVLALLGAFEDLTGLVVKQQDLTEEAQAWENGTNALVDSDEGLSRHVAAIVEANDASELPEATGEAIAREFERYLERRRRGDRPGFSDD